MAYCARCARSRRHWIDPPLTGNPLVAARVDTETPFSGAELLDSGTQLGSAIESGSWVQGGMAAFATAADTIATVSDPLGSLIAAGLALT
jgi:hypothetical protein